jgi:hypothetical protein
MQAHPQQVALPKKVRASRKPWTPERYKLVVEALSGTAKALGNSFNKPDTPNQVPKDAPDNGEWNGLAKDTLSFIPRYKDLYEERKKGPGGKKGHNGGLEQHIYLSRPMTDFLNNCGVLGQHKLPIDHTSGGLGICTRALFTSAMVAYVETHKLKHDSAKKYIAPDQYLTALIGAHGFEYLKTAKPKQPKKPKEGAKPKKHSPKVQMLERNGQEVLHFSFDAIPTICGLFVVDLPPNVNPEQRAQLGLIRDYLKGLTVVRTTARNEAVKAERANKKQQKVAQAIVPTQIMTMNLAPGAGPAIPQINQFQPGVYATQ